MPSSRKSARHSTRSPHDVIRVSGVLSVTDEECAPAGGWAGGPRRDFARGRSRGARGQAGDWGPLTTSRGAPGNPPEVPNLIAGGVLTVGRNGSPGRQSPAWPR